MDIWKNQITAYFTNEDYCKRDLNINLNGENRSIKLLESSHTLHVSLVNDISEYGEKYNRDVIDFLQKQLIHKYLGIKKKHLYE